jgi:hypothetical protein
VRTREAGRLVKGPKSEAGKRTVSIPPHLVPLLREHLAENVTGRDGLLFPSAGDPTKHLSHSTLNKVFLAAREKAGRPDLAFHDLRHTGAVLAAATGATLAELMARLGHSTPAAAMRYQHAAADRDKAIAAALSELAGGTVTSIAASPTRAKRKPATTTAPARPRRTCCLCGSAGRLERHRGAEISGGGAQWRCMDHDACVQRVQALTAAPMPGRRIARQPEREATP